MKRAKKIAAKRSKKTKKKIAVKRKRTVARERRPVDVFELLPKEKRKKRSYQWVTVSVMGVPRDIDLDRMLDAGWNPASRRNFPRLRKQWDKKAGGIVVGGQMLMERSEALTEKGKQAGIAAAKAILPKERMEIGQYTYAAGVTPNTAPVVGDGSWIELHKVAREAHDKRGGVYTTIKLRLSPREVEAAAICHLTVDAYADRKLRMGRAMGEPPIVLIENADGAFEISKLKIEKA